MTKSERAALREHWRQIVTECENRDASISKRAWCEEHGIVLRLLYYWQRQFREGNDEPQSAPAFLDLTDVWEERHEKPGESSSIPFDPVLTRNRRNRKLLRSTEGHLPMFRMSCASDKKGSTSILCASSCWPWLKSLSRFRLALFSHIIKDAGAVCKTRSMYSTVKVFLAFPGQMPYNKGE